ncbi:hypothetical protein Thpro_021151 [Acidihalobacter prosperus]|uniref:Uncharacterized protein n=1 Tax=Acidihalobacter prosperus TaxID=160660 RepID=A0A1A6C6A9_9GAMM|nr:hypothetical protein Thpro_021151 [Acidihalobacter prosperus]
MLGSIVTRHGGRILVSLSGRSAHGVLWVMGGSSGSGRRPCRTVDCGG